MIRQVILKSFKGFRDFKTSLNQFTNLVGLNSRGKTSILQAIKFAHDLLRLSFGSGRKADFGNVQWTFGPGDVLARYSLSDPAALWFRRNTSSACYVALAMHDNVVIEARVNGPSQCQLDLTIDGKPLRGQALNDTQKAAVQAILDENALYVPPLGATSGVEHWMPHGNLQHQLQQGRHTETWRNSLYWLYNDGDKDRYKDVVELVTRYIPESVILPPRLNHDNPPSVVIEFVEDAQKYDIGLSGAGLRSLVNLGSVLLLSDSRLLLLDEPDAHLHSSLQRVIARMLVDVAMERGIQIITASHAPDFIADTPIDSVYWVDRTDAEARPVNTLARALVDLGAISNTDAIIVNSAEAVLFVEGTTDRRVLSAAFTACGLTDPASDPKVIVAKLPDGKSSADGVRMLPPLLQGLVGKPIRVACLLDNDWELLSDDLKVSEKQAVICLPRKEIENYMIDPAVFARAASASAERRNKNGENSVKSPDESAVDAKLKEICESVRESVRCQLVWRYRERLPANLDESTREQRATQWFNDSWGDSTWILKAVPGKQVLAALRRWCQESYRLTVSDRLLLDSLKPVPNDLHTSLDVIVDCLYGPSGPVNASVSLSNRTTSEVSASPPSR